MNARSPSLVLVLFVAVIDGACSSEPADGAIELGCCDLAASPPQCGSLLIYGRRKRSVDDACIIGADGTIPDWRAAGWAKGADKDGCAVWVPPRGAPMISCGLGDSGFGCCEIGDTPPDCFRGYGRRKTSPTDDCGRGVWDGSIPDPRAAGWTRVTDADGCPVWKPPADARILTCGGDASPDSSSDAPAEASD